jgi:hypothetical protein
VSTRQSALNVGKPATTSRGPSGPRGSSAPASVWSSVFHKSKHLDAPCSRGGVYASHSLCPPVRVALKSLRQEGMDAARCPPAPADPHAGLEWRLESHISGVVPALSLAIRAMNDDHSQHESPNTPPSCGTQSARPSPRHARGSGDGRARRARAPWYRNSSRVGGASCRSTTSTWSTRRAAVQRRSWAVPSQ